jgi:hypothetical protein
MTLYVYSLAFSPILSRERVFTVIFRAYPTPPQSRTARPGSRTETTPFI